MSRAEYTHGAQTDVGNWEFSHGNKAVCGKTFMNYHKLNGENTRNILLNEAVYLCAIRTGHSFQRRIIVNLFHYNRSLE